MKTVVHNSESSGVKNKEIKCALALDYREKLFYKHCVHNLIKRSRVVVLKSVFVRTKPLSIYNSFFDECVCFTKALSDPILKNKMLH